MKKYKKLNKHKKNVLRLSKTRLQQQIKDNKISKKINKIIKNKKIVNYELLDFSIVKNGLKNNVIAVEKDFLSIKNNYEKNRHQKNKNAYINAKKKLKIEKKIEKKEIKQIIKLNNNPKGNVNILIKNEISIKVNNVNKYYPTKGFIKKALSNINLEFKKGTFNVILGESGSGKTTLLNIISGLDRATFGEVIINNINIQSLNEKETTLFRRENTGFVFQTYNLLSVLNVRDNIEIGRSLQNDGNKRQDIDKLLNKMNMRGQEKKMIYELSGGQQQRISIARALSKSPKILICDEPTGALDYAASKKIFEIFQEINRQYKTSIIIATHNQNVAKIANQVIRIKDGKIKDVYKNIKPIKAYNL